MIPTVADQRKIRASEESLIEVFHASSNPMIITTAREGRIVDVNDATLKLGGYRREEMIGCSSASLGFWADPSQRGAVIRRLETEGSVHNIRATLKKGTGGFVNILFSCSIVILDKKPCCLSSLVDVTVQENEARALRESEEKYRMLVENSLQGLAIVQGKRLVFCNRAFATMSGYSVEELLTFDSEQILSVFGPEDRELMKNRYLDRIAGKQAEMRYEYLGIRKDGTEYRAEVLASLVQYQGQPAVQMTCMDVTERKRAEAAARETGERLKLALEGAGMTSWDLDLRTGDVKDEDRWLKALGYSPDEVEPNVRWWNTLIHPDDLPGLEAAAASHLEGKTAAYECEHRIRNKAGEWRWVLDRGKVISHDPSGKPLRTVGVHMDVTEHKLAVEQIKQLANEQTAILDTISLGINYVRNRKIQWANPAFLNMFGYTTDELRELAVVDLFSQERDIRAVETEAYPKIAAGAVYAVEAPMKRKDGSVFWCSIAGRAINVADVKDGSIWAFQDIVERRLAERAVRENEQRFRRLLQNSSDIIVVLDEQYAPTYVSGTIEKNLGYKPEELIGADILANLHPDDVEPASRLLSGLKRKTDAVRRIEVRCRHKNGNWIPVESVATNMLHDPVVNGIVMNIRNISERNRLQEQLQQAMKMEAIGVLAGGVAHDFNNLLSVINGYAELLLEDLAPDDCRRSDLEQITKAGKRAASLTSQLLAFSRRQILQPELLDLNAIIADMSTMLTRMIGEDVEFVTMLQPNLGLISADPGQIQQIIMNLVANARDAMILGGLLTIETRSVLLDDDYVAEHPMVPPGDYVMMAVSDNGIGMSAVTRSRIFEPFFTTKEKTKGTGLGLSTVYGIVKQSNGFIWVYSEPEKGTTFKIYFPQAVGTLPGHDTEDEPQRAPDGAETVLLAEDEESVRALAARILRQQGYTVLEAQDGEAAIEIAREFAGDIDLVVTDVVMPGISGRTLVSRLEETRPGIRSLFISGYTDSAIVHHGLLDSDVAFLQKPFTMESLLRKVREVLPH